MHPRNFFFSPQGDRSSYIKSRAWNGLPGDVVFKPASVDLCKSRVNKLPLI
nr:unnamed protein product [Callosobruchus chinensis]